MEAIKDLAIVVKSIQFEERHRIVTAITQNYGLISALARNSVQSKRFGGALDLFTASDWLFRFKPHGELAFLSEAQVRNGFENLRKDFEKYSLASVLTEFLLRVAPQNQPCIELFQLHANALFALNEKEQSAPKTQPHGDSQEQESEIFFLNSYLMKLLQWSGNQPQLAACLHCQSVLESNNPQTEINCLIADAGWICKSCRTQSSRALQERREKGFLNSFFKVSPRALRDVQLSLSTPIRRVLLTSTSTREQQADLFRWIEALFIYHLPGFDQKPMKCLRFLGLESSVTSSSH